ncbi:hypothetical protein MY3296_001691 [Beauveria thailandica]
MANQDTNPNPRNLPATTAPPPTPNSDDSDNRCVICLDNVSDPCELGPCGHHSFDGGCIDTWIAVRPRCPLCKAVVHEIIRGPHGLPGRPVTRLPTPAELFRARYPPASSSPRGSASASSSSSSPSSPPSSSSSSSSRRGRRPRYTPADFVAAGAAYARTAAAAAARLPTTPTPTTSIAIRNRRDVYAQGLFSLPVDSSDSAAAVRAASHDVTTTRAPARFFLREPHVTTRARAFLLRELRVVFDYVPAVRAAFLADHVASMFRSARDVEELAAASELHILLAADLGGSAARLLMHELKAWLRSPYASLEEWDAAVRYPRLDEWTARAQRESRLQERRMMERLYQQLQQGEVREEFKFSAWLPYIPFGSPAAPSQPGGSMVSSADSVYAHAQFTYSMYLFRTYREHQ